MLVASQVERIAESSAPILSVYLNTRIKNSSRHPRTSAHLVWFRKETTAIAATLSSEDRTKFQKEADRVDLFLARRRPAEAGLAIFAAPNTWTVVPLQTSLENAISWGRPSVGQLFRLLNEHRPYGIVTVDHQAARFFVYRLGELTALGEKAFTINESEWKKKELGHVTGERVRKTRGCNRELFENRLEAQYERLCHETAEQAVRFWKECNFAGLFLAGPERLVNFIHSRIAQPFSALVVAVSDDLVNFSRNSILRRLETRIGEAEQKRQLAVVEQLLAAEGKFGTNPDEVLARLQNGSVRTLVVAADLDLHLRECAKCGFATRSADPACVSCGGGLRNVSLLEILPYLASAHHMKVEFVSGEAALLLMKSGGMGGWSRLSRMKATG